MERALSSLEAFRLEAKQKDEVIAKKNLMIERLKLKNQQRKAEIESEINNLKKFWEKYYETDDEERMKAENELSRSPQLRYSDSTATLRNTRTAQRPKLCRARTETQPAAQG
jgi:tagatose-1,6-bisphosphate aldolase non-catalytic subunit AgaZ/GatZ